MKKWNDITLRLFSESDTNYKIILFNSQYRANLLRSIIIGKDYAVAKH